MPDLILKQVISVIDKRTTMVCLRVAGQIVAVDQPFSTLMGDLMAPPFHVHCRSIVVPWMKGFVSDVRTDANAEIKRRPAKQRRYGPDGYGGSLPPRPPSTPPPTTTLKQVGNFDSDDEMYAWYAEQAAKYDRRAAEGMNSWVDYDYTEIQAALRSNGQWTSAINDLDHAMSQNALDRNLTVWRAVDMPDWAGKFKPGDVIDDEGFQATSLRPEFIDRWLDVDDAVQLEIRLKEGQRIAVPEAFGEYASEYGIGADSVLAGEVLLPRGTSLRVLETGSEVRDGRTIWRYVAEVVET